MSDDDGRGNASNREKTERMARIQGIRSQLEDFESRSYAYLDLPGVYQADPASQSPYIVSGTFIPEEIGGNVTVVNADASEDGTLAQENLNQMLSSFLPGGYKQRWGNFDLWRGAWHHDSEPNHADVGPMFEWRESFPLTDLLGSVSEVDYTELSFDPDTVQVYIPLTIRMTMEDKNDTNYVWIPDKGLVWTGDPPMTYESLSSDPTTNYLWFKHVLDESDAEQVIVDDGDIVQGFVFDDDRRFVRCYYASLLTLYPEKSTRTKSGIIRYRNEEDDNVAFIASKEQSQLLTFDLNRDSMRSRITEAIESDKYLQRDLRFAFLRSQVWDQLFFEERALESVFAIDPLIEHFVGIDYWRRVVDNEEMGVFSLAGYDVPGEVQRLLPDDSSRHLRLLGHEKPESSAALKTVRNNGPTISRLLAKCRNKDLLIEFAEQILVHSAEHALSAWSNNLTGSGTSFELWYDVTFQEQENDTAQIAVYDPVQGGAGIAKEVYERLQAESEPGIESGLSEQGMCHSATADRATVELLASHPDGTLYDVYHNDHDEFLSLAESVLEQFVDDFGAFSKPDLVSHVEQRTQTLFETRELAAFYSYVAGEYTVVEETVERLPRVVDLALHLDRHIFTDPRIKMTYERFADDSGRRDIAELGERLGELTVQCVSACPDCLKTDDSVCLHGVRQQEAKLNRRLLTAVFGA